MVAARRPGRKRHSQPASDRLLVEAAQADPSKFEALYELHFELVYFFILGRVQDRATAEDLTSEVFHKALANLSAYESRGTPFAAWLFRIASNAIADHYKRAKRELRDDDTLDPPAQPSISSKEMDFVERHAFLFRLVEKLPEIQRRVLYGRFIEERSIKEIAQHLRKSEGAVKQLQFRALETLRQQMGGRHE
ncbi:MAG: sigma-70 family RNA polymerase sigma factor [Acidobacteriaceae bacterium]|nr:sigma-70 family RNA polymerase sigma factor [Acidobacteriaceae bacterium]